ncbi:MAG: FtsW/RodA/SpoVE family cell cycle protein [Rikenellaceae bacterium]
METNNNNSAPLKLIYGDKVLWVIIAMLSIISILLVFSSTAKMAYDVTESSSPLRFLTTQLVYLFGSLVIMIFMHRFSVKMYGKFSWFLWGLWAFLTLISYFVGSTTNGAARWLPLGPIRIQPSEFLKVALVIHLAAMLTRNKLQIKSLKLFPSLKKSSKALNKRAWMDGVLRIVMPIFVSVGVVLSAHTSSAILIFIVSILILFVAGVRKTEIGKVILVALFCGGLFSLMGLGRSDTAGGRVETWAATWFEDRTQIKVDHISDTERSMIAMQNGGLLGQGAGQSSMRVEMIHPESDYAFAFFVEEYGLILSVLLLLLYLWVFFRAMWIYERCRDPFRELLVLSLAVLILVQALLHVMVSVNFLPETGQILPLVSRGGSALFCTYMAFMLMLSISAKCEQSPKLKKATRGHQKPL